MISLEKRIILTPWQKLLKNVKDLGKLIVAKVAQSAKNRPNLVTLVVPNVNAEAVLQDVSLKRSDAHKSKNKEEKTCLNV